MKKVIKILLGRAVVVALAMLIQILWIFLMLYRFSLQYSFVNIFLQLIAVFVVLYIINQWINPGYKIVWTFFILIFPLGGLTVYFIFGRPKLRKKTRESMERIHEEAVPYLPKDKEIEKEISLQSKSVANQSRYISDWSDFPIYKNTQTTYYSSGESMFPDMLKDLELAEHFIFMEFFIIAEGVMFDEILKILVEKVAMGVDVRIIYDDFGCITTLPSKFYRKMDKLGIKCVTFNRMLPILSVRMNNRDHRKILVVDGYIGYAGGLNIADEYINKKKRFGYWKDSVERIEGEAVWSLTTMFLEMWNYINQSSEDHAAFRPEVYQKSKFETDGYVQPYGDMPLDGEKVGANIYMNMIGHARDYVYIFTPYLILDNEMLTYLRSAAKSGVDIRIVTPAIPDKKIIFWMTQSYYQRLIECGIRIYQYTPGFIHAKSFVCDDRVATVGSINMDYRSLYLHFECGIWMYNTSSIMQLKQDSLETIAQSKEITLEYCKKKPWLMRVLWSILRLVAPLV
ncbi:cardiolipin synthase [Lachnospiraceae bacterium ZAX-1]